MIEGYPAVAQALMGTCLTWFLTAAGAAMIYVLPEDMNKQTEHMILDGSLGFSAGIMIAASFWSLLDPAIEAAEQSGIYGAHSYIPVAAGVILGALFVSYSGNLLPDVTPKQLADIEKYQHRSSSSTLNEIEREKKNDKWEAQEKAKRKKFEEERAHLSFRRIMIMVIAITVHNFPEGLAVGVGFGAIKDETTGSEGSFANAVNLALGIGLQNFPEGLAVSLPLLSLGVSKPKAFWYGQLSGMLEPIGGLIGAYAVDIARPLMPYSLSFAAGAMIFVVFHDLLPESFSNGFITLSSWGGMVGFVLMMCMDLGLG